MFGVKRYVWTLRSAIGNGESTIKWCAHSEKSNNNSNSVILANELLHKGGYKFQRDYFSIIRMHRVLVYSK
jgi:hypothetical protein